eukprot:7236677-Pyramimonas_sp.AAC.2
MYRQDSSHATAEGTILYGEASRPVGHSASQRCQVQWYSGGVIQWCSGTGRTAATSPRRVPSCMVYTEGTTEVWRIVRA